MADYCQLPLDVLVTILVRLSVMSLLRLRSVCKSWRSLIDSSQFINQHLLHEEANSNGGLIVKSHYLQKGWTLLSGHQFEVRVKIDPVRYFSLDRDEGHWYLVDSYNGIVCLSEMTRGEIVCVALWNPATRQLACLPELPLIPASKLRERAIEDLGSEADDDSGWGADDYRTNFGFGYAVKADDYKVIRVVEFMRPVLESSVLHHQVDIYDLSTNCWRNIDANLHSGPFISTSQIYCNGRYFWVMLELPRECRSILSFDFNDEAFENLLVPDVISNEDVYLTTVRDCIACINSKHSELFRDAEFGIWVMTKYGVNDSWTKLHTVRLIGDVTLEGFSKNGEILFLANLTKSGYEVACTDLKTQQIKNLKLRHYKLTIYQESLVSIKKAMYPTNSSSVTVHTLSTPTSQPLDYWTGA